MVLCEEKRQQARVQELCRKKLMGYAESFRELARSFDEEFDSENADRRSILEQYKLWENRRVIGSNLYEMSQIMSQLAGDIFSYQPLEERKTRYLSHMLKGEGIFLVNAVYIPEKEDRQTLALTLRSNRKGGVPAEPLAELLSVFFKQKCRLSVSSPYLVDGREQTFVFMEKPRFNALTGYAKVVKDTEKVSGDNYAILESEHGRKILLLSDGTGSGQDACDSSGQVLDLMEKLLETGYHPKRAIGLVNTAMFARQQEISHPTLDGCFLDLYEGTGAFYKVGAATSFLLRGGAVEPILGGTLPLGVFQNAEIRRQDVRLRDGDFLILVSDGVLDAFAGEDYEQGLMRFLEQVDSCNPGEIAKRLLEQAICKCEGHICDDMTVLAAGIWE